MKIRFSTTPLLMSTLAIMLLFAWGEAKSPLHAQPENGSEPAEEESAEPAAAATPEVVDEENAAPENPAVSEDGETESREAVPAAPGSLLRQEQQEIPEGAVVVLKVEGPISNPNLLYLRRALKQAEAANAEAVIIDMNTPGGALQTARDICEAFIRVEVPLITFVNSDAISAGALISLATDRIYMTSTGVIGSAAVVMGSGEDLQETMQKKVDAITTAFFESIAERRGHRTELVRAFVEADYEYKIGEEVIVEKGRLLALNATKAVREFDGQPLLATGVVDDIDALVEAEGFTGELVYFEPTGFEAAAFWLTSLSPLLLLLVVVCAYLEINSPGFGVPGLLGIGALLLFFASHYIAGLAGFELAALFFLGLALVLVELIFIPGTLILGVIGAFIMLGILLYTMADIYPSEGIFPNAEVFVEPTLVLALTTVGSLFVIAFLARIMPKTPGLRSLVLRSAVTGLEMGETYLPEASRFLQLGDVGQAISILRPSGKAVFDGQVIDVQSSGDFIDKGQDVLVEELRGNMVVVGLVKTVAQSASNT